MGRMRTAFYVMLGYVLLLMAPGAPRTAASSAVAETPTGFAGVALSETEILWSWNDTLGETHYELHDDAHTLIAFIPADTTSVIGGGLTADTTVSRHLHASEFGILGSPTMALSVTTLSGIGFCNIDLDKIDENSSQETTTGEEFKALVKDGETVGFSRIMLEEDPASYEVRCIARINNPDDPVAASYGVTHDVEVFGVPAGKAGQVEAVVSHRVHVSAFDDVPGMVVVGGTTTALHRLTTNFGGVIQDDTRLHVRMMPGGLPPMQITHSTSSSVTSEPQLGKATVFTNMRVVRNSPIPPAGLDLPAGAPRFLFIGLMSPFTLECDLVDTGAP